MRSTALVGVVLIVLGLAALAYQRINYMIVLTLWLTGQPGQWTAASGTLWLRAPEWRPRLPPTE